MLDSEYHLVVQVWIRNLKGEWLISKRAANKSQPLKWEPTGGSVLAGETSLQGALREVREEIGIVLNPADGVLFASYKRDKVSWENPGFLDVWVFEADFSMEEVQLQWEEACDDKWVSEAEIRSMIDTDEFVPMKVHPYYNELFAKWNRA